QPEGVPRPLGFSCSIIRLAPGRPLDKKDLYQATLEALLHYSFGDYESQAEQYTTRGDPAGSVVVVTRPGTELSPPLRPANRDVLWALYTSVIAFNNPVNVRESRATSRFIDTPTGQVYFYRAAPIPLTPELPSVDGTGEPNASSLSSSRGSRAADEMKKLAVRLTNGYSFQWIRVPGGSQIRRESAYDVIAYAILWTAREEQKEELADDDIRRVAFPGSPNYIAFTTYQVKQWKRLTFGEAALFAKTMAVYLELGPIFTEGFFQYLAPDGEIVGKIGIFVDASAADSLLTRNNTAAIAASKTGQIETA
ncbi:MAG: hypothetical protein Q9183_001513, partial [Haloplaca sp. 2 TL-2023]